MREELYPTKLHAFLSWFAPVLENHAKERYFKGSADRAKFGKVEVHYEGSLIRFGSLPGWEPYESNSTSTRGKIGGFSRKSRGRMMDLCSRIKSDAPALFVTLTYPKEWPLEPTQWKRHLDTFGKWLLREWPKASAVWKLEPQQRGAPHYHLLVWGISHLPHDALALRWYEIVGSNDLNHRFAGTRVERVRTARGVRRYASKSYMGKEFVMPPGWEYVGKFWGTIGRKNLPLSEFETIILTKAAMIKIRRIQRRYMQSIRIKRRTKASVRLYTEEHAQWLRVMLWANGEPFPALETILAKRAKRSAENCSPLAPRQ